MLNNESLIKTAGYINGEWIGAESTNRFNVNNAYSQELISTLPEMGKTETEQAIGRASCRERV